MSPRLSFGQRAADTVTERLGSWGFIFAQSAILAAWMALNVTAWCRHWDPYPFILLNLVLSFQAAFTGPLVLLSQRRQAENDSQTLREVRRLTEQLEQHQEQHGQMLTFIHRLVEAEEHEVQAILDVIRKPKS